MSELMDRLAFRLRYFQHLHGREIAASKPSLETWQPPGGLREALYAYIERVFAAVLKDQHADELISKLDEEDEQAFEKMLDNWTSIAENILDTELVSFEEFATLRTRASLSLGRPQLDVHRKVHTRLENLSRQIEPGPEMLPLLTFEDKLNKDLQVRLTKSEFQQLERLEKELEASTNSSSDWLMAHEWVEELLAAEMDELTMANAATVQHLPCAAHPSRAQHYQPRVTLTIAKEDIKAYFSGSADDTGGMNTSSGDAQGNSLHPRTSTKHNIAPLWPDFEAPVGIFTNHDVDLSRENGLITHRWKEKRGRLPWHLFNDDVYFQHGAPVIGKVPPLMLAIFENALKPSNMGTEMESMYERARESLLDPTLSDDEIQEREKRFMDSFGDDTATTLTPFGRSLSNTAEHEVEVCVDKVEDVFCDVVWETGAKTNAKLAEQKRQLAELISGPSERNAGADKSVLASATFVIIDDDDEDDVHREQIRRVPVKREFEESQSEKPDKIARLR